MLELVCLTSLFFFVLNIRLLESPCFKGGLSKWKAQWDKTKWLGRKVRFYDPQELELSSRIASAWGAFTKHKEELTCRRFRLRER